MILSGYENYGLLALRLAVGAIFFVHGTSKLKNWASIPGFFKFLGTCETLGSLATITGFLTQYASMGFSIIMLGAIYKKTREWKMPFTSDKATGWELDLLILASAIVLILFGAGLFSIDALAGFWP